MSRVFELLSPILENKCNVNPPVVQDTGISENDSEDSEKDSDEEEEMEFSGFTSQTQSD